MRLILLSSLLSVAVGAPTKVKPGPCVGEGCLEELLHDPTNPHHHQQEMMDKLTQSLNEPAPDKPRDRMEELHDQLMHAGVHDEHQEAPTAEARFDHGPDVRVHQDLRILAPEDDEAGADVPETLMESMHNQLMHADGSKHEEHNNEQDLKIPSGVEDPDILMHGGEGHDHEKVDEEVYQMDPDLVWKKEKKYRLRNKPTFSLKYITDAIMDEIDSLKSRWGSPGEFEEVENEIEEPRVESESEIQKEMKEKSSVVDEIPSVEQVENERIVDGRVMSSRQRAMMADKSRDHKTMRRPLDL